MKRTVAIILGVLLTIVLLIFVFFEIKDVPAIKKSSSYKIEELDQGGLYILHQMLNTRYGENHVQVIESDSLSYLSDYDDHLWVMAGNYFDFDTTESQIIHEFASRGNEVLIIAERAKFHSNTESHHIYYNSYADTLITIEWPDCTSYTFTDKIEEEYYPSRIHIRYISIDSNWMSCGYTEMPMVNEKYSILTKIQCDDSEYFLHSIPQLFTNGGALKTDYLTNFNKTFDLFASSRVLIHQSNKVNYYTGLNDKSLLQYILAKPALKYAYYLSLFLALIFVIFASKRKQKEIPILKKKENTSHEYIETISALYMAQGQNARLATHMKSNFYHKVKTTYFLDGQSPDFVQKLAKKSKYPVDKIQAIVKQLNIVDQYAFNDDQLIRLYKDIYSFDKNKK